MLEGKIIKLFSVRMTHVANIITPLFKFDILMTIGSVPTANVQQVEYPCRKLTMIILCVKLDS